MDGQHVILVFLGVIFCSITCSSLLLEKTVERGDNITIYCDCKVSKGVYIVWVRNCSHENQPSLVLSIKEISMKQYSYGGKWDISQKSPRYSFVRNFSSDSYDLVITNATHSDEGFYYCGTEEVKVEKKEIITHRDIYRYGSIVTRLTVNSSHPDPDLNQTLQDCDRCWKLFFILLPAVSVFFALLSFFLVYLLYQKSAKKSQENERKCETRQREETQGEDVCYAALEILQATQRPNRKSKSNDFSTLSAVKWIPDGHGFNLATEM